MKTSYSLPINFFQSANADDDIISDDFVVRVNEFEIIMEEIRNYPMVGSVQHFLLLGRRGSGKSTLLKRIEHEIKSDSKLNKSLIPINPAEEQANIYRLMDLWEEIIRELRHQGFEIEELTELNKFPDNSSDYNRNLYSSIHNALKKANKKVVLLLDNIDRVFDNLNEDASLVREILLNFDDIRIIGGSTKMSEHFWNYDLPLYNFFRVIALSALSNSEVKTLLLHWATQYNLPEIKNFVENKPGQLETIRILTDGLPRTLKFFISIVISRTQEDSYQYLKQIMDYVTPLYQERLNALPPVHRKIILNLAFVWESTPVKRLAQICKIESKLMSANLNQLSQNGLVEKVETKKRNHLYRISERFFNLWLIFTQGSPSDKRKQKCLTIFLENWYDGTEIRQLAKQHLKELTNKEAQRNDVALFSKALAHSRYITIYERDAIIDRTLRLENISQSLKETLPPKATYIIDEIIKNIDNENWKRAEELIENIDQDDGTKENLIGKLEYRQGKIKNAEKCLKASYKKGKQEALLGLGLVSEVLKKYKDAEKYYLLSSAKNEIHANLGLADMYYRLAINKEAALENLNKFRVKNTEVPTSAFHLILQIWNGIFESAKTRIFQIISTEIETQGFLIEQLFIHDQIQLINLLFEDEKIGEGLRKEFPVYYYIAKMKLNKEEVELITLTIPPEILTTVNELIKHIEEYNSYYYPNKLKAN